RTHPSPLPGGELDDCSEAFALLVRSRSGHGDRIRQASSRDKGSTLSPSASGGDGRGEQGPRIPRDYAAARCTERARPKTGQGRNPEFNGGGGWVRCVDTPAWIFEVRGNLPSHRSGGEQTRESPSLGGLPPDTRRRSTGVGHRLVHGVPFSTKPQQNTATGRGGDSRCAVCSW